MIAIGIVIQVQLIEAVVIIVNHTVVQLQLYPITVVTPVMNYPANTQKKIPIRHIIHIWREMPLMRIIEQDRVA